MSYYKVLYKHDRKAGSTILGIFMTSIYGQNEGDAYYDKLSKTAEQIDDIEYELVDLEKVLGNIELFSKDEEDILFQYHHEGEMMYSVPFEGTVEMRLDRLEKKIEELHKMMSNSILT